jgi:hypothetical protein
MRKAISAWILIAAGTAMPCSAQDNTVYIGLPVCSVEHPSGCKDPAERARYEKERDEKQARDWFALQDETRRKQEEDALVHAEMRRLKLPPHREAEVRNSLKLKASAEEARNARASPGGSACTTELKSSVTTNWPLAKSMGEARIAPPREIVYYRCDVKSVATAQVGAPTNCRTVATDALRGPLGEKSIRYACDFPYSCEVTTCRGPPGRATPNR